MTIVPSSGRTVAYAPHRNAGEEWSSYRFVLRDGKWYRQLHTGKPAGTQHHARAESWQRAMREEDIRVAAHAEASQGT